MRWVRVWNQTRGTTLAERAEVAETFLRRGLGLMGRTDWARSDGMVIRPCNSIHCFLMRLPIDVAYVDRKGQVCRLLHSLKPWRLGPIVWRSDYVLELPDGILRDRCAVGDLLVLESSRE